MRKARILRRAILAPRSGHQESAASHSDDRPIMVFHTPFPMEQNPASASRIRPLRMLNSFKELGFEVIEIVGTPRERRRAFRQLRQRVRAGAKVQFAYSENSTQPNVLATSVRHGLAPFLEAALFVYLRLKKIPFGEFYRDVYWRFPESVQGVSLQRRLMMSVLYRFDVAVLRAARAHIFLPSTAMAPIVPVPPSRSSELPPGCDVIDSQRPDGLHLFYVGGLGAHYGLHLCLKAVNRVPGTTLTLCVPKSGWETMRHEYQPLLSDRIRVVHASSSELEPLYAEASVGVLFVEPSEYRAFATPMKFFEYLGHGKPIIASSGTHAGSMAARLGVGIELPYTEEALVAMLHALADDRDLLQTLADRAEHVRMEHTWLSRARQVVEQLSA